MIETRNLTRRFPQETGLEYTDLTFATGRSYVLLGASGCGKSTLLNLIAGVLTPTTGTVTVDGIPLSARSQRERDRFRIQKIGYIFQDFRLIEEMTVEDNIRLLQIEHVDVSGLQKLLDELGIGALRRRKVRRLSGGEKQRVAIARALIKRPDIVLADEPTGNLNYAVGRQVMEKLLDTARGRTLITVTHDERLAQLFDERIDMNAVARPIAAREGGEGKC